MTLTIVLALIIAAAALTLTLAGRRDRDIELIAEEVAVQLQVRDALQLAVDSACIDVGRQRLAGRAGITLAGPDNGCVVDNCVAVVADGSDFCTPCLTMLRRGHR